MLPLVMGTLSTTVIALLVAVPLGLGAAMYLSEYANDRIRRIIKPILEILAGVPTVVYGVIALTILTPILQDFAGRGDLQQPVPRHRDGVHDRADGGLALGGCHVGGAAGDA